MLRQYHEAKAQAKEALLFFRLGDFYELFYEDARLAAQLLGITLTSRAKGDDRVPMAGVPYHAAKAYVVRLVAAGYKVALCDQVEVPGPGKQLVRREIVRLVTPGTVFEEDDAREPVWLGALALDDERCALALLDASTGELRALQPGPFGAVLDELQRARPKELLVPEDLLGTPRADAALRASCAVRIEGRTPRGGAEAQRFLQRHLGVATLDGFGLREPLSIEASADALSYLQETQRSAAQHVVRVQVEQPSQALWIDPSAVQNLELFRGPDGRRDRTLLSVVDRTLTAAGSRMLARWLAAPLAQVQPIAARHDVVDELSQAAVVREELAEELRGVLDIERLLGRLAVGQGVPRDLGGLRASLRRMPALSRRLAACSSPLLRELAPALAGVSDLCALLEGALAEELPAGREPGFVRTGYRADLDELADLAQGGRAAIASLEAEERARTGIQSLKIRYNRVSGFYIEVTKPNLHLVPADYQRRSSTVGAERFVTPALTDHEARVLAADERRAALEQQIFEELRAAMLARSAELRACAAATAEADALLSLARVASESGWVRPVIDESDVIEVIQGRHPVVERALAASGDGPFVPNDLALDSQRRLVVLTGPNMAGKSTAMRQVALIVVLAQAGSFVPAQRVRIGLVDRLFTRVGAADDHGGDGRVRADPPPGDAAIAVVARRSGARDQHLRRARAGVGDRRAPARRLQGADALRDPLPRAVRPRAREAARRESDDGRLGRERTGRLPAASRSRRRLAQLWHPRGAARRTAGSRHRPGAGDPRESRIAGARRGGTSRARVRSQESARAARFVRRCARRFCSAAAAVGSWGDGTGGGAARGRSLADDAARGAALVARAAEEAPLIFAQPCEIPAAKLVILNGLSDRGATLSFQGRTMALEDAMDVVKLWRCPSCNRVLRERSVGEAQRRHAELVRAHCRGQADFVAEAMWPAFLASLRRCRCGSRRRLKPLHEPPRGQLDLHLDAVVLQ